MEGETPKTNHMMIASDWKPSEKEGTNLKGRFDVHLPSGLTVCGMGYFEKGKARWCGPPVQSFTRRDGGPGYTRIIGFRDTKTEDNFKQQALAALDQLLADLKSGKEKQDTEKEPEF